LRAFNASDCLLLRQEDPQGVDRERPAFPFFVVPGSSRTSPLRQSMWRHSSGRTSLCARQPVIAVNRITERERLGQVREHGTKLVGLEVPARTFFSSSIRNAGRTITASVTDRFKIVAALSGPETDRDAARLRRALPRCRMLA
jgi:hypothetical protein